MDWPRRAGSRHGFSNPWWRDPTRVDGYRVDGVPWPVETSRFAYLAPVGGVTEELDPGRIGINRQALEENTELQAGDQVTVSVFEGRRPYPVLMRPTFEVVPLDFETPDAFLHSTEGEAVLPVEDTRYEELGIDQLGPELRVVLNGVLAVRMRQRDASGA
ncbi:MAG: hypothetical protein R3185_01360 [Candidatus Thermoplasmatota archaeon]|nr:hypothetical protein [Candidatus Thermoplasmatota archaeon]